MSGGSCGDLQINVRGNSQCRCMPKALSFGLWSLLTTSERAAEETNLPEQDRAPRGSANLVVVTFFLA